MTSSSLWNQFRAWGERESMLPDLGRAIRAMFAVTVPLLVAHWGWLPLNLTFVVFAAQSVAIVDVRGAYTLRLGLLLTMTLILAGASSLGGAISSSVVACILGAGLVAACGGLWRHFTPDYGASLAISSTLLFLISINSPPATNLLDHHGIGAMVGALWGVFLQVANWPIRPQHPLRRAASDSWVAVADLFAALAPEPTSERSARIREREAILRTTLDHTYAALASARSAPLRTRLEELNLGAARLATRVVALNTALESLLTTPEGAAFSASLQPLLTSLTNTSRSVAVTVVSRQPGHLANCEVRIQRLGHLIRAVIGQTPPEMAASHGGAQLIAILKQIDQNLPHLLETLRATVDRSGERGAFSLQLFDLDTWTLRPLASALNLRRQPDPALVRFTARVVVLTMLGVAVFKLWNLPHGYWLPLTMIIVLQPDYGSTRQRAVERVLGTLGGSVFASLLMWLRLPSLALIFTTGLTIFCFGFFMKRQYAVAVFFITLAVVLLTEAHGPVTLAFTVERLASTLAGGALALIAALFFWPVWERDRLPPILSAAIAANQRFAELIAERFVSGGTYDSIAIAAKRQAEAANSAVFASLQRMMGDPRNRREGLEQVAASANGNQRVTRALTVLAVQLTGGTKFDSPAVTDAFRQIGEALKHLADAARTGRLIRLQDTSPVPEIRITLPTSQSSLEQSTRDHGVLIQLARIGTELNAMRLSASATESVNASPSVIASAPS